MIGLRIVIIAVMLMALIHGVIGEKSKFTFHRYFSGDGQYPKPCTYHPSINPFYPPCQTSPAVPTQSTTDTPNDSLKTNVSESSSLERAHWCRFGNGSYIPLNYTYLHNRCSLCQCSLSHAIRCRPLECMPTYCIDGKMPSRKSEQCCTQCDTDVVKGPCEYNGVLYPHGTIMTMDDTVQCWCQLGNIECRDFMGSLFQRWSIWGDGTMIYVMLFTLFAILSFGLLLCCGCTLYIYSYYKRNQYEFDQAYDQYMGTGGWQPIYEEEEYIDYTGVEEKHIEAEKYQPTNPVHDFLPPPYAIDKESYVPTDEQKTI